MYDAGKKQASSWILAPALALSAFVLFPPSPSPLVASSPPRGSTRVLTGASVLDNAASDLGQRIVGGTVIRNDSGIIIVEPEKSIDDGNSSLTADAVLISSLRAKISSEAKLRSEEYNVQVNDGIVSIHATNPSLEDAITVINLALSLADVREIVYVMPPVKVS
jgi:hypothetical protein